MKELRTLVELDGALADSHEAAIFIFKHSTQCPISAKAHGEVKGYLAQKGESEPEGFLVKVIESRPVSNEITQRLGLPHKSPQVILIKDGKVLWDESHLAITADAIAQAVRALDA
ncbi:MAG TPA: bacillithiol system redox-active protein YtxJ [Candidatus Hydrogenedentes bacterium]|nr:bacillithiol system redox-active protein YtxJ [Candidatus Hydrogenedentota bacterium]HIJ73454.1 bacillithiol system redox-active protein YtxJ [Candidatus Hydrogenedentota bacterium]